MADKLYLMTYLTYSAHDRYKLSLAEVEVGFMLVLSHSLFCLANHFAWSLSQLPRLHPILCRLPLGSDR